MKVKDKFLKAVSKKYPKQHKKLVELWNTVEDSDRKLYYKQRYKKEKWGRWEKYKAKVTAQGKTYISQKERTIISKERIKLIKKEFRKINNKAEIARKLNLTRERVRQLLK